MRLLRTLAIVCCLLTLLPACGKQYLRPTPPERCPPIPDAGKTADDLAIWAGVMVDEYTRCAAKVDALHD